MFWRISTLQDFFNCGCNKQSGDLWIPGAASIELIIGIFFLIPIFIVENIFIWNIAGSLQALVNGHRQRGRGGVTSYLGNAKIYGGLFLLHLQWQSVSSHRVLKLTQQFGGIGGAIGYPLLSSCQCPPGGRALLMKPLQQPIARDWLLHRWLCIFSVSSVHQWYFHPSPIPVFTSHTDAASWKAFPGAEQCFWHCQGAEDISPSKIFPWSPTYIEQDSPLPSPLAVALGQRPILLYFIFLPPPTTKITCQCLQRSYHRVIVIHICRKDFLFQPRSKSETLPKAKRTQSSSAFSKRQHKWEEKKLFLAKHLLPLFNQTLAKLYFLPSSSARVTSVNPQQQRSLHWIQLGTG